MSIKTKIVHLYSKLFSRYSNLWIAMLVITLIVSFALPMTIEDVDGEVTVIGEQETSAGHISYAWVELLGQQSELNTVVKVWVPYKVSLIKGDKVILNKSHSLLPGIHHYRFGELVVH